MSWTPAESWTSPASMDRWRLSECQRHPRLFQKNSAGFVTKLWKLETITTKTKVIIMLSAIQANSCKPVFFLKRKKKAKKNDLKKQKKSKKKANKKRLEKQGQKRRFEKAKKSKKNKQKPRKAMKPAGNGNKKRKNQWKKRRWQWKEACTLSWTRHSQKGVQPPRWPYPGTWAGGSNPLADPTPGPGWGDRGRRRCQKSLFFFVFFCFFLGKKRKKSKKKAKKKKQKKKEKNAIWEDPPFQTRGSPQVSSHLHHFPGWSSQICKVSPKPSQSSCAQAPCHDPRHTLSSASSKSRMTFSAKATPSVFLLFFSNCFFFLFFFSLFYCFFCFFLLFCLLFFVFFCFFF